MTSAALTDAREVLYARVVSGSKQPAWSGANGDPTSAAAGNGARGTDGVHRAGATSPAMRLLDRYLTEAVACGASDVHFEPAADHLRVRVRVDGSLRDLEPPPPGLIAALLTRTRLLARVDLSERRLPQDGRFVFGADDRRIEIRAAFMPVHGGEKVALRLLREQGKQLALDDLGLQAEDAELLRRALDRPNGLVLVVGATGTGKTTTLYAALEAIRSPARSILTVEDPVERDLDGIAQVPVDEDAGRSFAVVLRAVLRQDPDVLMVGEIRDPESARIACRAALTGHLVLSTLHTAHTRESIVRLTEMGVPGYLVSATVSLVVAQRLIRRPCETCKQEVAAGAADTDLFRAHGVAPPQTVVATRGCDACGGTGYKGRSAVFEVLDCTNGRRPARPRASLLTQALRSAASHQTTPAEALARCPDPGSGSSVESR
jgi:type II secretory ATPase GspE/PulE/Tfp pilus assembly ATPase PilB-like protein